MTLKSITSLQHPHIKHLTKLRQQRSYRKECRLLVIEGKKLIYELHPILDINSILVSDESLLPTGISYGVGYHVTNEIIQKITGTVSPEGIVAEVKMPEEAPLDTFQSMIVLDRIQDPGNVGTIIRTALAFGWETIYCIEGTCDIWNDKVIRASRGAAFQIPFHYGSWDQLLELLHKIDATAYAADLGGQPLDTVSKPKGPVALVLGNEGQGLSEQALSGCQKVTIPINNEMESLNVSVAGGILMYYLGGQSHG